VAAKERVFREYSAKAITLSKEVRDGQVFLTVFNSGQTVVSASGTSTREAAQWLVRHLNRLVRHAEDLVVEIGFLSVEEIDAAVLDDEDRAATKT
jgi:sugar phosphate isomerase/epimerase